MVNVTAYTPGRRVPSARFRVRQYIPALHRLGVEVREFSPAMGSYPPGGFLRRLAWGPLLLAERAAGALRSFRSDITLFQREMVSTLLTLEPLTRGPRVLDVDDAIYLHRNGQTASRLARLCDLVICGNEFLRSWFCRYHPRVEILPTAVDTARFTPNAVSRKAGPRRLGWSGSSSGFKYLAAVAPAIANVMGDHRDVRLTVVADREPPPMGIDPLRIDYVTWSERDEVGAVQSFTAGLMPLVDDEWARGKCSFKLLTYMACGVPSVASPVGMNRDVLNAGGGLAAQTLAEWEQALRDLLDNESEADRLGQTGRVVTVRDFSIDSLAPRLAALLEGVRR